MWRVIRSRLHVKGGDAMSAIAERPVATSIAEQPPTSSTALQRYQFNAEQFLDMVEMGFFDGKRVEFIGGEVVEMSSQGNKHLGTIRRIERFLEGVFGK